MIRGCVSIRRKGSAPRRSKPSGFLVNWALPVVPLRTFEVLREAGPTVLDQVRMAIDRGVGRRNLVGREDPIQDDVPVQVEEELFLVRHAFARLRRLKASQAASPSAGSESAAICKVEMPTVRNAPDPHQGRLPVADPSRDEPDDEADPPVVGAVRVRAVDDVAVMQRHLRRLEHEVKHLGIVNVRADPLAATEQVIAVGPLDVVEKAPRVRAGDSPCMQPL